MADLSSGVGDLGLPRPARHRGRGLARWFSLGGFDRPGEYALFCSLHPQVTGRVVVDD
jgi:hypothetical protein